MDATHGACQGLWVRDLLATVGPFVLLAALLLGLAYLVLDPTPPRHVVLATGPARSDVAEFGARMFSGAHSGTCRPQPRKPSGLIVGLRAMNSDESTTGVGRRRVFADPISVP